LEESVVPAIISGSVIERNPQRLPQPPENGRTISTLSPDDRGREGHSARRQPVPFTATARNRAAGSTPHAARSSATVPAVISSSTPLTRSRAIIPYEANAESATPRTVGRWGSAKRSGANGAATSGNRPVNT